MLYMLIQTMKNLLHLMNSKIFGVVEKYDGLYDALNEKINNLDKYINTESNNNTIIQKIIKFDDSKYKKFNYFQNFSNP